MLKKLYKHEFYALLRNLWPLYLALLVLALVNRLILSFRLPEGILRDVTEAVFLTGYVLSILALVVLSLTLVILRFYRHLMTSEGYLTFSLPVKASSHLTCKLVCGAIAILLSVGGIFLSLLLLLWGTQSGTAFWQLVQQAYAGLATALGEGNVQLMLWAVVGMLVLGIISVLVSFFFSITFGHQFKNPIAAAVLCLFALYLVVQIIGMITIVPPIISTVGDTAIPSPAAVTALFRKLFTILPILWITIDTALFISTRILLTKKLNLT